MTSSSKAEGRYWYCPCCGKKYNAGHNLKDRLLIIGPPSSNHSVKEQNVTAENNSESQSSTQVSSATATKQN
eukprot:12930361-Prorocentrum_lima.AAC.1